MPGGASTSKGHTNRTKLRETVKGYLDVPVPDRVPLKKWLREHRLTRPLFERVSGWVEMERRLLDADLPNIRAVQSILYDDMMGHEEKEQLDAIALDERVLGEAMKGNYKHAELWYRRKRLLKDKEEHTSGNTNILQIVINALDDNPTSSGNQEVPGEFALLRDSLCEDSGPDEDGDNPVPALGPPPGTDKPPR